MATSDFVLDEGLDDDEDVLAFHSQRQQTQNPETPDPLSPPQSPTLSVSHPDTDTVIIDGMPLSTSRRDLNTFLSSCGDQITSLQLRRMPDHDMIRARVKFHTPAAVSLALARDGSAFTGTDRVVSVKPASPERWDDGCGLQGTKETADRTVGVPQASLLQNLPDTNAVKSGFWSAFCAAKAAAEKLETQAKRLGEELEGRLQVSEKITETREAIVDVDRKLLVSKRVGEMAAAGKAAAQGVDETYGISKQVGKIVNDVGSAARIVASEVDENLHLSDKAREATNMALKHDSIGPTVRSVVDSLGAKADEGIAGSPANDTPRRRKNYQPSGIPQPDIDANVPGVDN